MKHGNKLNLSKTNFRILLIGMILITIGFIILGTGGAIASSIAIRFGDPESPEVIEFVNRMATGEKTVSPIILVIGYVIFIPLALMFPVKHDKKDE